MRDILDFFYGCILFAPCVVLTAFVVCEFFNFILK